MRKNKAMVEIGEEFQAEPCTSSIRWSSRTRSCSACRGACSPPSSRTSLIGHGPFCCYESATSTATSTSSTFSRRLLTTAGDILTSRREDRPHFIIVDTAVITIVPQFLIKLLHEPQMFYWEVFESYVKHFFLSLHLSLFLFFSYFSVSLTFFLFSFFSRSLDVTIFLAELLLSENLCQR